jgi:hypothetical protein
MKQEPFSLVVSRVPWNVFATLTFRSEPSAVRAERELKKWLRWAAHISGVKYRNFLFLGRLEQGELSKRVHLHCCLCVPARCLGYFVVGARRISLAHKAWKLGMTRFRQISGFGDSAVTYLLKDTSGADSYESIKTAAGRHLVMPLCLKHSVRGRLKGLREAADTGTGRATTLATVSGLAKETEGDESSPYACERKEVSTVGLSQVRTGFAR